VEQEPELMNLLTAFPYMTKDTIGVIAGSKEKIRFLLDSGAFTAWKAGSAISLDDYCNFIEKSPVKPWRYFTLDVIGDPRASMVNYELMLKRGFTPIPIFTRGEEVSVIDDYYKTSDVVAVGGLVATIGNRGFVNGIMEKIGKRQCHWLGFTSMEFLKHYRPYSCDTSSWESGARYGAISLYAGHGTVIRFSKKDFAKPPAPRLAALIRSYGLDPAVLARTAAWHGGPSPNRTLNAFSGVRQALDIGRSLGTRFFNAAANSQAIRLLLMGYDFEQQKRRST
jgi:hypothetical protein